MSHRGNARGRGEGGFRGGAGISRGRGPPGTSGGGGPSPASSEGPGRSDSGPRGRGGPGRPQGGFDPRGRGFSSGGGGGPRGRGGATGPVIFAEGRPATIPPRLSEENHNKLISSFKSLQVRYDRPLRPGYGTNGTPITLRANFFAVKLPKGPFYNYTVEITPKTDINRLKIRIFHLMERSPICVPHLPFIAHDRSQRVVSARKLPQPLDIPVPFFDDDETGPRPGATVYMVSIKFDRELDLTEMTK